MAKSNFSEALMKVAIDYWVAQLKPDAEPTPGDDYAMGRIALTAPPAATGIIERARALMVPKPEQLDVFTDILKKLLIEPIGGELTPEREYGVISPRWVELRTDYEAQGLLLVAAKAAGISSRAFPFKTILLIKHGCIYEGGSERGKKLFEGPAPQSEWGHVD